MPSLTFCKDPAKLQSKQCEDNLCPAHCENHARMSQITGTYHSFLAILRKTEDGVCILVVQIVKEDAATPSALIVAVLDHKVVIAPLLELGPILRVMLFTDSLGTT